MEERKLEGTYSESEDKEEWYGHYYECNECGEAFMLNLNKNKCFCPGCGRYLIRKDVVNDVE